MPRGEKRCEGPGGRGARGGGVDGEQDQALERRQGEKEKEAAKKPAPGEAEAGDGADADAEAASCDYCGAAAAAVYCRADAARLCLPCDRHVHGADGGLLPPHPRPALRRPPRLLRRLPLLQLRLREAPGWQRRRAGAPRPLHGAALLWVPPSDRARGAPRGAPLRQAGRRRQPAAEDGGWWNIWEEPQVLSLEDLIVPTTSCHGFQPLLTPSSPKNGSWNNNGYHVLNDACKVELTYDQAPVSSAEACLSSFVPMSEICPSMSDGSSMEENHQINPGLGTPAQAFPKRTGFDVVPCPDRGSVISRYKEKKKTRSPSDEFPKDIDLEHKWKGGGSHNSQGIPVQLWFPK
ncbi:hypothetical protein C2845_PM07G25860 [Panicum miliaceum]|uniref:B box-type domain-containing protein n=1 Tax=Panicum miliaceum TaxID=4540 RepID=A0A3L6SMK4_PANMI|nr:hypothetical protein C2845_PM07G25860 [Panicum miliaceum]